MRQKGMVGYSLVEVMIAAVIFSICVTSVLYGVLQAQKITRSLGELTVGMNVARSQLELIKSLEFEEIDYGKKIDEESVIPDEESFVPLKLYRQTSPQLRDLKWGVRIEKKIVVPHEFTTTDGSESESMEIERGRRPAAALKEVTVIVKWTGAATSTERTSELMTWINPYLPRL